MSHLSTLIDRVRNRASKSEFLELRHSSIFAQEVVNLIEYMMAWTDWDRGEYHNAIALWNTYHNIINLKDQPSLKQRFKEAMENIEDGTVHVRLSEIEGGYYD